MHVHTYIRIIIRYSLQVSLQLNVCTRTYFSKFVIKLVSYWRVHEPCRSAFNTQKPRTSVFNACKYSQIDLNLHVHVKFNIHS